MRQLVAAPEPPSPPPEGAAAGVTAFEVLVVDSIGAAVPYCAIAVWKAEARSGLWLRSGTAPVAQLVADANGRLRVESREVVLIAEKPGVGRSGEVVVGRPGIPPEPERVTILELHELTVVRGTVSDEVGSPASGVSIRLRLARQPEWITGRVSVPPVVRTDDQGRFICSVTRGGVYVLSAIDPRRNATRAVIQTAEKDEVDVVLRLTGDLGVSGHVAGVDGASVAKANVVLQPEPERSDEARLANLGRLVTLTGPSGIFSFATKTAGAHRIQAHSREAGVSEVVVVQTDMAAPLQWVNLRLRGVGQIRGHLQGAGGGAVQGVRLHLVAQPGIVESLQYGPVLSQEDGSFEFDGVPAAIECSLYKEEPGQIDRYSLLAENLVVGRTSSVLIPNSPDVVELAGRVVCGATGDEIEDFEIEIVRHDRNTVLQDTGNVKRAPGHYSVSGLSRGEKISLIVRPRGYAVSLAGPVTVVENSQHLDVSVTRCGALRVRLIGVDGEPQANRKVTIRPLDPLPGGEFVIPRRTNEEATAKWPDLRPTTYVIGVVGEGELDRVTVPAGDSIEVVVALR